MSDGYITKGSRVRAEWLHTRPVALAGMQMKVEGRPVSIVGVIAHFRSEHPTEPVNVRIYLDTEDEPGLPRVKPYGCTHDRGHVEIQPGWVREVLP